MEERPDTARRIDARLAAWISSSSPCAAGYYLYSGALLPQPEQNPERMYRWKDRMVADVLRECYRKGSLDSSFERVKATTIKVMPEPEGGDGLMHDAWKVSVASTSRKVSDCLRYGPTATFSGGESLLACGELEAQVSGLRLRQWIDLLRRHPDGSLEAILLDEEPNTGKRPGPLEEDWRCIMVAAVILAVHGASPRVHLIRIPAGVAQTVSFRIEDLDRKIADLARSVSEARGPSDCDESFVYPISVEAVEPLQRKMWPQARDLPVGTSRRRRGEPRRSEGGDVA